MRKFRNNKIALLDKYIFSQIFGASFVCILLFMIIWIAPETLLRTVQRTLSGDYTIRMAVLTILGKIPEILGNALPIGVLLGTLYHFLE